MTSFVPKTFHTSYRTKLWPFHLNLGPFKNRQLYQICFSVLLKSLTKLHKVDPNEALIKIDDMVRRRETSHSLFREVQGIHLQLPDFLVTQDRLCLWMTNCQDIPTMPWSQEICSFIQGGIFLMPLWSHSQKQAT